MYTFNTTIHARPPETMAGPTIELHRRRFATLAIPHEALAHPFNFSFEAAVERLNQLERMFSEPDGSFVWTSPHDGPMWQIDGNLFDRNGRLLFVDLKGVARQRNLTVYSWHSAGRKRHSSFNSFARPSSSTNPNSAAGPAEPHRTQTLERGEFLNKRKRRKQRILLTYRTVNLVNPV